MKSMGENGFVWFIGVVENRDDPEKMGLVQVRIHNLHSDSKAILPTKDLPWASVLLPLNSSSLNKVGISPTGLQVGSTVVGFFLDGHTATIPVLIGVLPGIDDPSPLVRGQQSINKEPIGFEPPSAFNAKYPFNKVVQTESGHVIELDDTPNFERMHTYHRSGTYQEINNDGRRVSKIVDDEIEVVLKDKKLYVQGDVTIEVKGSYTLNVTGPVVINGQTINFNRGTQGAARKGDTADTADAGGSVGTNKIETGSSTVLIGD